MNFVAATLTTLETPAPVTPGKQPPEEFPAEPDPGIVPDFPPPDEEPQPSVIPDAPREPKPVEVPEPSEPDPVEVPSPNEPGPVEVPSPNEPGPVEVPLPSGPEPVPEPVGPPEVQPVPA